MSFLYNAFCPLSCKHRYISVISGFLKHAEKVACWSKAGSQQLENRASYARHFATTKKAISTQVPHTITCKHLSDYFCSNSPTEANQDAFHARVMDHVSYRPHLLWTTSPTDHSDAEIRGSPLFYLPFHPPFASVSPAAGNLERRLPNRDIETLNN